MLDQLVQLTNADDGTDVYLNPLQFGMMVAGPGGSTRIYAGGGSVDVSEDMNTIYSLIVRPSD